MQHRISQALGVKRSPLAGSFGSPKKLLPGIVKTGLPSVLLRHNNFSLPNVLVDSKL